MSHSGAKSHRKTPRSFEERAQLTDVLLEELARVNAEGRPLIVEGPSDVQALRELGFTGNVLRLNRGLSVLGTVEELAGELSEAVQNHEACYAWGDLRPGFIILMDWDRKGDQLANRLKEAALACDLLADDSYRLKLKALTGSTISCVEDLPSFLAHAPDST